MNKVSKAVVSMTVKIWDDTQIRNSAYYLSLTESIFNDKRENK